MAKLQANLKRPESGMGANIRTPDSALDAALPGTLVITVERETYAGPYEVTPKVTEQTIETKGKVMREDLTVKEVPVYRVTNASGGTTVYIASEV